MSHIWSTTLEMGFHIKPLPTETFSANKFQIKNENENESEKEKTF